MSEHFIRPLPKRYTRSSFETTQRQRATRYVASRAVDAGDASELLQALGLIPYRTKGATA